MIHHDLPSLHIKFIEEGVGGERVNCLFDQIKRDKRIICNILLESYRKWMYNCNRHRCKTTISYSTIWSSVEMSVCLNFLKNHLSFCTRNSHFHPHTNRCSSVTDFLLDHHVMMFRFHRFSSLVVTPEAVAKFVLWVEFLNIKADFSAEQMQRVSSTPHWSANTKIRRKRCRWQNPWDLKFLHFSLFSI